MKFAIVLFILNTLPLFAGTTSPCWMVRIEKSHSQGTIKGSGYILDKNGARYVRTASHVVLGNFEGVRIKGCDGREIPFDKKSYVSNNMLDDILLKIDSISYPPLGTYDSKLKNYIVTKNSYQQLIRHKRRVSVGPRLQITGSLIREDSYISPDWVRRPYFSYDLRSSDPTMKAIGTNPIELEQGLSRKALFTDILLADVAIIPGESGSPLVGWLPYTNTELQEDITIDSSRRMVAVVKGHALAYHRRFFISKFLSAESFKSLDMYTTDLRGQDISLTHWDVHNGEEFRVFQSPDLVVAEFNQNTLKAGDGTAGHGGDGTAGHGGDGTAGHGGDGTAGHGGDGQGKNEILVGLPYNNQQAIAFRLRDIKGLELSKMEDLRSFFTSQAYLAANWYNFTLLNKIQANNKQKIYEVVDKTQIVHFLRERLESSNAYRASQMSCRVSSLALMDGTFKLEIQLGALPGDEVLVYESPLTDLQPLINLRSNNFGKLNVDLSGIFGIDISFLSKSYFQQEQIKPSILINQAGRKTIRYECVLF